MRAQRHARIGRAGRRGGVDDGTVGPVWIEAEKDEYGTPDELVHAKGDRTAKGRECTKFTVEPRVVQILNKPRGQVNHSYRDFSGVPIETGYVFPTDISMMSFPEKVYHMLADQRNSDWISWMPHGRAFRVHRPNMYEKNVSEKYFGHKRYSSFLRLLSNHGFKQFQEGIDRGCQYHELMLRGLPHLLKYFPKPTSARRLVPDTANEPNFYIISKTYPLPEDPHCGKVDSVNKEEHKQPNQKTASRDIGERALVSSRPVCTALSDPLPFQRSASESPSQAVLPGSMSSAEQSTATAIPPVSFHGLALLTSAAFFSLAQQLSIHDQIQPRPGSVSSLPSDERRGHESTTAIYLAAALLSGGYSRESKTSASPQGASSVGGSDVLETFFGLRK